MNDFATSTIELLQQADVDDLDILVDYLTDKGEGRVMLDGDHCKTLVACKTARSYSSVHRELIFNEIRAFGGNTLVNVFRGGGIAYPELVGDVADHVKVANSKTTPLVMSEIAILKKLFDDAMAKMTDEERASIMKEMGITDLSPLGPAATAAAIAAGKLGGFATYKMALFVANSIAKALLGKGLTIATNAGLTKALSVMLGPVGWVITGLWTVADLASPAYRVTVPCIVQIAYMRQKALAAGGPVECPKCRSMNKPGAKFCSDCGATTTK